ncbi:MAG: hypothetical protein WDO19_02250 [Bacteroidota bacterium]
MKAIGDVQFAVTNDLLSPALQNTDALQSFANFLLDGTTSKLESVLKDSNGKEYLKDSNGKEYHPADGDMLKKFEQLKADILNYAGKEILQCELIPIKKINSI